MAWQMIDGNPYYYAVTNVNGKMKCTYIPTGGPDRMAAEMDSIVREMLQDRLAESRRVRAELIGMRQLGDWLTREFELLTKAAIIVAGYSLHSRSEWRRRG